MCVDFDGSERAAFCNDTVHTARKPHKCSECRREIAQGERYVRTAGLWDGNFHIYKRCLHCDVMQDWLLAECSGFYYTEVLSDIREHISECGVPAYGFALARLVVLSGNGWRRRGQLVPVPAMPLTTHQRLSAKAAA